MATPPPTHTPTKHPRQPAGTPASSQHYLDVAQIRDGVVVLRDGSLRAVVLVNAVNFALKSEEEQNALIYAYQGFLNSFNFPIQIVMQSRQLDLAHYLKKLSDQLAETTNELVALQISDYIQFIERLIQIANIMDKKFYVTVPFTPTTVRQRSWFDTLFNPGNRLQVRMSPAEFKSYRQELLERARIIMGGLSGMGLRSALLGTQEVIELFYATYNPEEATKERLSEVENITGAYVHPGTGAHGKQEIAASSPTTTTTAANPLASVVPENTSEQPIANSKQQAEPAVAPERAETQPSASSPQPLTDDTTLPAPLGPTVAPPAEGPDAGRTTPVTTGLGARDETKPPAAPAPTVEAQPTVPASDEPQPLGQAPANGNKLVADNSAPTRVPIASTPVPTTGFGQPAASPATPPVPLRSA